MKSKVIHIFLLNIILMLLLLAPAQANHYLYLAEDPFKQDTDSYLTDNFVLVWWWWGWNTLWWTDPAGGSQFISDVQTAVGNWENTIPQLAWQETASQSLADIKFKLSSAPCGAPNAAGCIDVLDWEHRTSPNGNEHASYMKKVDVYISSAVNWKESQYRIKSIAHEAGHIYGLNEQYVDDVWPLGCNPDVNSLMDGNYEIVEGGITKVIPCDILYTPTNLDVSRVKAFWGGWDSWTPENLKRSEPISGAVGVGTWIITTWQDFAWAEQVHQVGWYWGNSSSGPWNLYKEETVTDLIGVHFYTEPRVIRRDVDRVASGGQAGWHIMCGRTWSVPFQRWGNTRCSNPVQLN